MAVAQPRPLLSVLLVEGDHANPLLGLSDEFLGMAAVQSGAQRTPDASTMV